MQNKKATRKKKQIKKQKKCKQNAKKNAKKNKKTKKTKAKAKGTYKKQNFKSQSVFGCKSKYLTSCKQIFKLPAASKKNMEQKLIPSILTMIMMWLKINGFNLEWPPTNSGIMDFTCNFPAKIAQQPRDQNHKQFERPNLLNPNWNLQRFCWIKSLLGKGKGSSAGTSLLRDKFC